MQSSSQVNTFESCVRYVIRIVRDEMADVICHKQGLKGPNISYNYNDTIQ